jgi:hypothetical protein
VVGHFNITRRPSGRHNIGELKMTITIPRSKISQSDFERRLSQKYGFDKIKKTQNQTACYLYYLELDEADRDGLTTRHIATYNETNGEIGYGVEHLETVNIATEVKHIAFEFQTELRAELSGDEMDDLIARNRTYKTVYPDCLSHNYCDANQVMIDAFNAYFQSSGEAVTFDAGNDQHMEIIDEAWMLARVFNFNNVWHEYEALVESWSYKLDGTCQIRFSI